MSVLSDQLAELSPEHREALEWFHQRRGEIIEWPDQLNGLFLVEKAKGIRVPKGWPYAISVRETLGSKYGDRKPVEGADGSWTYEYHQEGNDPEERDRFHTNRALLECAEDDVPVAVLIQTKAKPRAAYRVLGLARIAGWSKGFFRLEGYNDSGGAVPSAAHSAEPEIPDRKYQPLDVDDARRRVIAQIVARQGGRKFRQAALDRYSRKCAISGCSVEAVLEAAHIVPYRNMGTNVPDNGLLLRGDLHTLFDLQLLRIDPKTLKVILHEDLLASPEYQGFAGREVVVPPGVDRTLLRRRLSERAKFLGQQKHPLGHSANFSKA